jgi:hypothetical protein
MLGIKPELRFVGIAWDLERHCLAPEIGSALVRLLSHTTNPAATSIAVDTAQEILQRLDEEADRLRLAALDELQERNSALVARKRASLDTYYHNRLQRVQMDSQRASDERIIRMREAERGRIERDYGRKCQEIDERRDADIISRRLAAGILEVRHGK